MISVLTTSLCWLLAATTGSIGLTVPPCLLSALLTVLLFASLYWTLSPPLLPSHFPHNPVCPPCISFSSSSLHLCLPHHPAPTSPPPSPLPPLCLCPHLTLPGLNCCWCPFGSGTAGAAAESQAPWLPLYTVHSVCLSHLHYQNSHISLIYSDFSPLMLLLFECCLIRHFYFLATCIRSMQEQSLRFSHIFSATE